MIFTKSLQDLAQYFKCSRKQKQADEFAEIHLSKKKVTDITTKMIYGVGKEIQQPRSNSCKIVPAPMGGFFAVRKDHQIKKKVEADVDDATPISGTTAVDTVTADP